MLEIAKVDKNNAFLITQFLEKAGVSLSTFRYYNKRDISIIDNHVCTLLLLENGTPIVYGHLDLENNTTWLGIAVAEGHTGKGHGKKMMRKLLEVAVELEVEEIFLSVDVDNTFAIRLYNSFGFQPIKQFETYILYKKSLK